MSTASPTFDLNNTLSQLAGAVSGKKLTADAATNIRPWLTEPRYGDYVAEVARVDPASQVEGCSTTRFGRSFPSAPAVGAVACTIGSNAINDRTIAKAPKAWSTTSSRSILVRRIWRAHIAYDTRHRSRHFAELCAGIMAAAGFTVYFLDGYRSTPELSFAVRYKKCHCGIMVTASHNPPSDNAVKVYWSTGGQVLPPHDAGIIKQVMECDTIRRMPLTRPWTGKSHCLPGRGG